MTERECVVCGEVFAPRGPQKTCGAECRVEHKRKINRERYYSRRGVVSEIECEVCGELFCGRFREQKTCGVECRKIRNRRRSKERYRLLNPRGAGGWCVVCGVAFGGKFRPTRKTCCETCRRIYVSAKRKAELLRAKRVCCVCGDSFFPRGPQKACDQKCQRLHRKRYQKRFYVTQRRQVSAAAAAGSVVNATRVLDGLLKKAATNG